MTDPKEFESIDDLFRKTFDNLPDAPAASGWDAPSEQVWQHVQARIKPPRSGWSTQTVALIAAFAVTLAVGLYFYAGRSETPETKQPRTPTAVVETPANPDNAVAQTPPPAPETSVAQKKKTGTGKRSNPAVPDSARQAGDAANTQNQLSAAENERRTDRKRVSPNTTQRIKAELARRAEAAWKTPLEPLPARWPKPAEKNRAE